jgi:hypothetical protein
MYEVFVIKCSNQANRRYFSLQAPISQYNDTLLGLCHQPCQSQQKLCRNKRDGVVHVWERPARKHQFMP